MEEKYVTIVGVSNYCQIDIMRPGQIITLCKDYENFYDEEAIAAYLEPQTIKIGYVANSVNTVARGTKSAGRIYDTFEEVMEAEILFVIRGAIIAKVKI